MGCCGNNRQKQYGKQSEAQALVQRHAPAHGTLSGDYGKVFFQYVGKTGLTAIGPMSGTRYRFAAPGAILPVDQRDRRSLLNVPNLVQVKPAS